MTDILGKFLQNVRVPQGGDRIHKDECAFCFDDAEDGLFICLKTWLGFCQKHVLLHNKRTSNNLFLNIVRTFEEPEIEEDVSKKPTKLAIAVEGGFAGEVKKKFNDLYKVFLLDPDNSVSGENLVGTYFPIPDVSLPLVIQTAVDSIIKHQSAGIIDQCAAWEDSDCRPLSKHADNLVQLDNGVKIPPSGWRCQESGMTENLWLNLTDGTIFSGRANYAGTGGTGAALRHYESTGFPLSVKLGTITPNGADVWSYAEDCLVSDPHLAKHLAHFGIDIMKMEKTDKSLTEMEIDLNRDVEVLSALSRDAPEVHGPGMIGLVNLGSSCFLNAVLQAIVHIPEFQKKYFDSCESIFQNSPADPTSDFDTQLAKLAYGLLSPNSRHKAVKPRMLRTVVGRGHQEFSTNKQCDASELYQYFMELVRRADKASHSTSHAWSPFQFRMEERTEDFASKQVRYSFREENMLSLPVPVALAANKKQIDDFNDAVRKSAEEDRNNTDAVAGERPKRAKRETAPRPIVPLELCLQTFLQTDSIEGTSKTQTCRLATFPKYLMVQLRKFHLTENWMPAKVDASVPPPNAGEDIDLSCLLGKGPQPGENIARAVDDSAPQWQPDAALLENVSSMGFPVEACRRALYNTGNIDMEAALNWLCEHSSDADFASRFLPPAVSQSNTAKPEVSEESIQMLSAMGFSVKQAKAALEACNGSLERAADWAFSHEEQLEQSASTAEAPQPEEVLTNGSPHYKLIAVVSHLGSSATCGHYVCHLRKDDKWVLFNDEKVVISNEIPWELGFMYLMERKDA